MKVLSAGVQMQSMESVVSKSIMDSISSVVDTTIRNDEARYRIEHSLSILMDSYLRQRYVRQYDINFSTENFQTKLSVYFSITSSKTFCFNCLLS